MANVSLKQIRKSFGAVEIIKGVDLDIAHGEFVVFVGPSGCGKSTLLRLIAGLEEITAGTLSIGDKVVNNLPPKDRSVAMVFQSYALFPHMTVRDNVAFGLKIAGAPKAELEAKVAEAARMLKLEPLLDRKPAQLSGGQRQRVAIGRALVREVDVFLFDEPLSNLDAKLRSELRVELKRLHNRLKNTMIYVTHDQIEALTLADRIAIMRGGIIQQLDAPQTIYNRPANLFVAGFIGSPAMNFLKGQTVNGGRQFIFGDVSLDLAGYEGGAIMDRPKAIIGLRPEHLSIVDHAIPGHTIPAMVEIDEPMGADSLVWFLVEGAQMSVRVPVELRPEIGSNVHLRVDIAKASLFDETNELRI